MAESIRVLHVDDDPSLGQLVVELLEGEDGRFSVESVTSADEGLDQLAGSQFDCIVSDHEMPGRSGIEFLETVRETYPDLPFILFTGKGSEEVASEAISAGVTDYIQKKGTTDQYALLANRVANAVEGYHARREVDWQETVLRNMGEGIYVFDDDYVLQYVNFRVSDLEDVSEEDWIGRDLSYLAEAGVLSSEEVTAIKRGGDRIRRGETDEVRLELEPALPEPAQVLELRLRPVQSVADEDVILGTTRDITDRHEQARELAAAEARYRALAENFPNGGVFYFDTDRRYRIVSVSGFEPLETAPEDLRGKRPSEVDPFAEDVAELMESTMTATLDGTEETLELTYEGRVYELRSAPIRDDEGEIIAGLFVTQDVTDRRERKRALEKKNARLEEFTRIVSHDLRSPLTVAQANLELAQEECESDRLDTAESALERGSALIDDLGTLAREGETATEPEPVDLASLTRACWETVTTAEATIDVATDRTVLADRGRLRQALANLVRNAVEHGSTSPDSQARQDAVEHGSTGNQNPADSDDAVAHGGSEVTVTVGDLDDGFFVADDGVGVPDDQQDEIFQSGYSTTRDGTGFGLTIVEQVVEEHGWTIELTESSDGGARFEITDVERPTDEQ